MDGMKLEIKMEIERVNELTAKARRDLDFERFEALVKLNLEFETVAALLGQVDQRLLRVQEIKASCQLDTPQVQFPQSEADQKIVLRLILRYADKDSLLKLRLVNSIWDSEVVLHLLKTSPFNNHALDLYEVCEETMGIRTLENLHFLLTTSKHPELLINTLKISQCKYTVDTSPLNNYLCEDILRNFGQHVTNLDIDEEKEFTVVRKCLGQNAFCPNVKQLSLLIFEDCEDGLEQFCSFVKNMGELKVKKLIFEICDEAVWNEKSYKSVLIVVDGILNNSRLLEHLDIYTTSDQTEGQTPLVIQLLKSKPEVTKNLKELRLHENLLDNLQSLSQLQFTSNLKLIHFTELAMLPSSKFKTTEKEQKEGLTKFLKVVSPHLTTFGFDCKSVTSGVNLSEIPLMPKLEELRFWSSPNATAEADDYDSFLRNCPKLRKLKLIDSKIKTMEQFVNSVLQKGDYVYDHLEEIIFKSKIVENPKTLETLSLAFPHISRLNIAPVIHWKRNPRHWFQNYFTFISQMGNLKSFTLDFGGWKYNSLFDEDLSAPFATLKNAPSLVHLTLEGFDANGSEAKLMASSLPALVGAPSLRQITFHCPQVTDENLKTRILHIVKVKDFANNGIWNSPGWFLISTPHLIISELIFLELLAPLLYYYTTLLYVLIITSQKIT